jgi:hypothetical protein
MTNVVHLPKDEDADYWLATTLIDNTRPPEPGELVAYQFSFEGKWGSVYFARWEGPTGRDENGKFIRKGSSEEYHALDTGLKYSADDDCIRILGTVTDARLERAMHAPLTLENVPAPAGP